MRFYMDLFFKIIFAFSILPFLIAEKMQTKFTIRLDPQVVDTLYSQPQAVSRLENKDIDEASGLAFSWTNPNILYTHNDSGGDPVVFMLDTMGKDKGRILLEGVSNRDWEDIAIGPGQKPNESYIYVGDIGDNDSRHSDIRIFRFPEPRSWKEEISIKPEKITLKYPDGARDAETLMVDPVSGDLFILSKRDSSNTLYTVAADKLWENTGVKTMEKVMKLPITMSTAGDISKDGSQIIIKNYWVIYHWDRKEGESVPEALAREPILLPYTPEPQGEAITFFPDGKGYFTLSEKRMRVEPVLYKYTRLNNPY
ncbi:hypothetical protein [Lunatibacter salilacus]|uniref:hypothetical protein n=1 Tax=Lunatibacter salilacus TaxID=2483804 RepID=UPI00131C1082|nr:hypothetical protein [Lunatibacter salilacus]